MTPLRDDLWRSFRLLAHCPLAHSPTRRLISYEPAHCVVCGHTDARIIATQDDLRSEVEALWEFHQARLRPDTPPAHLLDGVAFSQHPPLAVVQCRECGLVYRNPVERQHELTEIYARTTPTPEVLRALHETQLSAI